MRRIVVIGGRGFFGAAAAELLRHDGSPPLVASRRQGADLIADAEDPASLRAAQGVGRRMTKRFGETSGGFGVELEDATGARRSSGFVHSTRSYIVAVAPAVLAARRIAAGTFSSSGLLRSDRQVEPWELVEYLRAAGVRDFGISD